ncbi:uncharacterized protein LOC108913808 isoform X1 [Anoplophora glabripennis]|uniref:uncharacterized protein LOC108913808 isoform X1 n=1 Tax=Anoplophora glabripennis TaxID=217634 RepID=UPI000C7914E3|nr:uncharacterized protein LOC108913808 isoform X1 [Anoplophora glabripennis]
MEITPLAPPSVQLVPAKEYNGAPIGTSYDIRAYVADRADEKLHRRTTVRMGIRVVQRAFAPPSPHMYVPGGGGSTCKERAKQNMKALLSGCKSAPLEATFTKGEQAISRSTEMMPQGYTKLNNIGDSPEIKMKNCRLAADTAIQNGTTLSVPALHTEEKHNPPSNEDAKCGTHVSFKEQSTNDSRTSLETVRGAPLAEEESESPDVSETQNEPSKGTVAREDEKVSTDGDKKLCDYYRSLCGAKRPSLAAYLAGVPAPKAYAEKFYMLSDGKIYLTASLDKAIYSHGEEINVNVQIENNSNKTIKRIKVFVVQHVDVCMFSNGKFKNVVAMLNAKEDCPIHHGGYLDKTYTLIPMKSSTKNWIALEDSYTKSGTSLASTVTSTFQVHNPDDRNVFAIYVSYYVKVKLLVSLMGGEVSLKLPFTLMHTCTEFEHAETLARVRPDVRLQLKTDASAEPIKPEKDGT